MCEMEEDDDVASSNWLAFECLDLDTCHVLEGLFNKWRIATWHDLVELDLNGKRGQLSRN